MADMEEYHNIINFGAGPAKIPREVLEEIKGELLSFNNTGMSITELSHRSKEYMEINQQTQELLRQLLNIPANYSVLFVAGGGQGQFAAIPLNLIGRTGTADYLVTGIWSRIAAEEAKNHGNINIAVDSQDEHSIPDPKTWKLNSNASYVYYCDNDTIQGVEFPFTPETNGVPLVADMSSNFLTKRIDVSKFGVIFAASQKNLGTAGIAVVIIRNDLLGEAQKHCPNVLNYTLLSKYTSIYNTPPIFSVYILGKILQWVKKEGGLDRMESLSRHKSQLIYEYIDQTEGFYNIFANKPVRSKINICIRIGNSTGDADLEEKFIQEAELHNMYQLRGHHLVKGIRISLFNSITIKEVKTLLKFMIEFEAKHRK
ncbi:unnamed protein product [Psylliodes chrysocephalus]|uniref:Phosphoserine aminotransferase n=1 Tax=Psylliodes chrysocephalus TaxID=3402493 RepID=A0A9P0G9A5_9CUCU|nr:unnamed protein product [Psylliodes chrysocephala]